VTSEPNWDELDRDKLLRIMAVNAWQTAHTLNHIQSILSHIRYVLFATVGIAAGYVIRFQFTGTWICVSHARDNQRLFGTGIRCK
jgi:hypothetical protein